jgi:hypothetical protein
VLSRRGRTGIARTSRTQPATAAVLVFPITRPQFIKPHYSPSTAERHRSPVREGADRPVPRGHSEQITVDGETEPVLIKLGVWASSTRARRDKLTQEQLDALRELGMEWA